MPWEWAKKMAKKQKDKEKKKRNIFCKALAARGNDSSDGSGQIENL